ncbi:MAG: lamin tail domain-containing protein [Vicinamibacteria bacterium]
MVAIGAGVAFAMGAAPADAQTATAGQLLISEFRLRGPSGAQDEFIELYNNSGASHTVVAASGTGYGVAASDGTTRCSIPNGTIIPAGGHYLCVNSATYSIGAYPGGNGTTATGDATYTTDIPDNAGIALFNNNPGGGSYSLANRLDAVGSTSEANTTYKEGTGYPALTPFSIDYSFYRDDCGKVGSITTMGVCTVSTPVDTDNNATNFIFVDTNGTSAGAGQRLGAPGPQNLSSPIQRNSTFATVLIDATVSGSNPPNRLRDFTSIPAQNSTFGTISLRRRFVNNTGGNVTRLRYRVVDITTFPAPSGIADLRPRTSASVVVAGINDAATCLATGAPVTPPCTATVQGTTLETPPAQPNGSGFNGSMSAGTVTLGTPLANGASINLQLLNGIQQTGNFKVYLNIEALP